MLTKLRLVALIAVMSAAPARADLWNASNGTVWNNPMSSLAATMIQGKMNEKMMANAIAKRNGGTAAPAAPQASHFSIDKSDFRPTGQRLVVDQLVSALAKTPEQQQGLSQTVNQVFDVFEAKARKNNVANALAFMLQTAVLVEKNVELDDQQFLNLSAAMNDYLVANAAFTNASATDKQKIYETFVTVGALTALFNEVGKNNADAKKVAQALAKQTLGMISSK